MKQMLRYYRATGTAAGMATRLLGAKRGSAGKRKTSSSAAAPPMVVSRRSTKYIVDLLFKAIRCCFLGHRSNEVYIARHGFGVWQPAAAVRGGTFLEFLLAQLDEAEYFDAPKCLRDLVTNNLKLLQNEVTSDTIAKFVELIKRKGPERQMMEFLVGLCTCR